MKKFFEVLYQSKISKARVGRIYTAHGVIDTPNFVAVGTNGTIKALDNKMVSSIGLQLMFCNTYHLLLHPGPEIISKANGLHSFINRTLPIITDSGGFQVFSLAYGSVASELKSKGMKKNENNVLKISEEGVTFRSYRNGMKISLTPESSIQIQKQLQSDIIIPFDELPPYHTSIEDLERSLERTHRWEERSLLEHKKNPQNQAIYGVVHGGINKDLRKKSALFLSSLSFDGFAIGGSVGKNKNEMLEMLTFTTDLLPKECPSHLLGIGDIDSLKMCVPLGIDTFDSSYPTKAARHGVALSKNGNVKITKTIYREQFSPIEEGCSCWTCRNFHLAYLHHLFKAKEITALTLTTIHNLHFMVELMKEYRQRIFEDKV